MKHLKLYESYNKDDKLNEEWFPSGPFFKLTDDSKGTAIEVYGENGHGLVFIKGGGDHEEQIIKILDTLYSEEYIEDNFNVHGVYDTTIKFLTVYKNNLNGNYNGFLDKYGDINDKSHDVVSVQLTNPIEIKIKEGESKTNINFNRKLDRLYHLLDSDNSEIKYSKDLEDSIDGLINKLSGFEYKDDED